ncbi:hypothetical protein ZWY2020_052430 [Hordeum vulgare]|nr:hypothetical protein ZWY2020_052430 [Hordeum vulgare]
MVRRPRRAVAGRRNHVDGGCRRRGHGAASGGVRGEGAVHRAAWVHARWSFKPRRSRGQSEGVVRDSERASLGAGGWGRRSRGAGVAGAGRVGAWLR